MDSSVLDCLASMSCFDKGSIPESWVSIPLFPELEGRLSSLTLSAYLRVFNVCSEEVAQGDIFPIIKVRQFPVKESFKTKVSLLPLNGVCFLSWSKALIHSLRARRDLLISAPSNLRL
jgi:hypothetical protein